MTVGDFSYGFGQLMFNLLISEKQCAEANFISVANSTNAEVSEEHMEFQLPKEAMMLMWNILLSKKTLQIFISSGMSKPHE